MIYNNFTMYNNSSENSSKAIVHKTKEKKWKLRKKKHFILIWVFLRNFHIFYGFCLNSILS